MLLLNAVPTVPEKVDAVTTGAKYILNVMVVEGVLVPTILVAVT